VTHLTFTSLSRVIYDACTIVLICINQHTKFKVPSFTNSKDMIAAILKNESRDPDHAPLRVSSSGWGTI